MKKAIFIVLIFCSLLLLTACNTEPYIEGRCDFSESSFVLTVEQIKDNEIGLNIEKMTFIKIN